MNKGRYFAYVNLIGSIDDKDDDFFSMDSMEESTPEDRLRQSTMRLRIKAIPHAGEMDGYDLDRFRVGEIYDVSAHLASLLIIGGYAEPVSGRWQRYTPADSNRLRKD